MEKSIFKNGSTTYYWSSKFFHGKVRKDVFKLYSFVRVADNFVDSIPADKEKFYELKTAWEDKKEPKDPVIRQVVQNIEYLAEKYDFDNRWIEDFLAAMEQDLGTVKYESLWDSLEYVYGSAEVVGYMMAKILGLDSEAMQAAGLQGRAMQWINFIRDIDEDNNLGRCYFPTGVLKKYGLKDLSRKTAETNPEGFKKFVRSEIKRYEKWQIQAEAGYRFIPKRYLVPVKTASDMYSWTASQIKKDPFVVFERKIIPRKLRITQTVAKNILPL